MIFRCIPIVISDFDSNFDGDIVKVLAPEFLLDISIYFYMEKNWYVFTQM